MPLVPRRLHRDIKNAFKAAKKGATPAEGEEIFAQRLTKAIDKYIKSGDVTIKGSRGKVV